MAPALCGILELNSRILFHRLQANLAQPAFPRTLAHLTCTISHVSSLHSVPSFEFTFRSVTLFHKGCFSSLNKN